VARHRLHNFVKNLALVGRGESIIRTKFTEGTSLDACRVLHQELVNDNYSCSSNGEDLEWKRGYASGHWPSYHLPFWAIKLSHYSFATQQRSSFASRCYIRSWRLRGWTS